MKAIWKHELALYSHSLSAYVFGAFLLEFIGVGAMIYNINYAVANFEYALGLFSVCLVGLVPLLTMRVMAEDKRQRTDQLLALLPVSSTEVVLGKFFALLVVFCIPMLFVGIYPLLFSRYGEVYLPAAYGAVIAFALLGMSLLSIGMFLSSLTESQGMAAGTTAAVLLLCYFSTSLADSISSTAFNVVALGAIALLLGKLTAHLTQLAWAGGLVGGLGLLGIGVLWVKDSSGLATLLPELMEKLSPFARFDTFVSGVFDLTAVVYYCSVTAFFLFLCVQSLEKRRYLG